MLFLCYVPLKKKKKAYSSFLAEAPITSSGGTQNLFEVVKLRVRLVRCNSSCNGIVIHV